MREQPIMSPASLVFPRLDGLPRVELGRLATTLLVGFAVVLLARRAAGALVVPLEIPSALVCGLAIGGLAAAAGFGRTLGTPHRIAILFATIGACLALSLPGTRLGASALMWLAALGGSTTGLWNGRKQEPPSAATPACSTPDDAALTLVRRTTAVGDECSGTARTVLTAGQKSATIHLAFCPPFAAVPIAEVAIVDASDFTVRPQPIYPYAARLEVRPTGPLVAPREIVVRFRFVVRHAPTNSS